MNHCTHITTNYIFSFVDVNLLEDIFQVKYWNTNKRKMHPHFHPDFNSLPANSVLWCWIDRPIFLN